MSRLILSLFIFVSNTTLLLFTLRRWLFLLTVWRLGDWEIGDWRLEERRAKGEGRRAKGNSLPSPLTSRLSPILLLIPFRDEATNLRQLLPLIEQLDYPADYLTIVLIDDGSQDESGRFCQQFITNHTLSNWHLLTLPHNIGKAAALNEALNQFPQGKFVAVFDGDERPSPHTLTHLLTAFTENDIAAVNGRRAIINPLTSPIASYATLENFVHQTITNPAKDELNLAPALLGSNCLYRREALTAVHNFTANSLLEDSDLTLRFAQAGWRTRFIPNAISHHAVPHSLRGYWQQHTRWHSGFQQVAQTQTTTILTQSHLPFHLRLELLLFSLGYLDRLALLIALTCWWQRPSRSAALNISLNLLTPLLQIIYALKQNKAPNLLWQRLIYLPFFYTLDIAATLTSTLQKLTRQPVRWEPRSL